MDSNWKLLMRMGLSRGAARRVSGHGLEDAAAIHQAVDGLAAQHLDPTDTDVLAAWLSAFKRHWPSTFATVLGEVGESGLRTLIMARAGPNRYLKLRRIAIANLANIL